MVASLLKAAFDQHQSSSIEFETLLDISHFHTLKGQREQLNSSIGCWNHAVNSRCSRLPRHLTCGDVSQSNVDVISFNLLLQNLASFTAPGKF